jgi:hypothetical protein
MVPESTCPGNPGMCKAAVMPDSVSEVVTGEDDVMLTV